MTLTSEENNSIKSKEKGLELRLRKRTMWEDPSLTQILNAENPLLRNKVDTSKFKT